MDKLKKCPFCGQQGKLRRLSTGYKTNPVVIMDKWTVICPGECCSIKVFESEIFQNENGAVEVRHNGAEEAISAWNKRTHD